MQGGNLSPFVFAVGRHSPGGVSLLGTGFSIGEGLVATAAHVVGYDDAGLVIVLPQNNNSHEYQDTTNNKVATVPVKLKSFDSVRDLAVLEVPGLIARDRYIIGSTDETPPLTAVVTAGFPHAGNGRMVLTQHAASVGARVLLGTSGAKVKHMVLNIQTRPGQSGSPVLAGGKIVAVILGAYKPSDGGGIVIGDIDPSTLHQTTHAVSAEYLKDMVQ